MSGRVELEPRAPFPYFGGKRNIAQLVWDEFGDVGHFIEPFCGSCAILLARPRSHRRACETVNDRDGMLVNVWRSLRDAPDEVARVCADPVMECEYHARLAAIDAARADFVPWIEGDPAHHDARLAGFWIYCQSLAIGSIFDSGGPWRVVDGRLVDTRALPHLGDAGKGINRELPNIGVRAEGVNRDAVSAAAVWGGREASIRAYLRALAARLERVRIVCGDWRRVVSSRSVLFAGQPTAGVFVDPPYAGRGEDIYDGVASGVAAEAEEWARGAGAAANVRIAICGYRDEHNALLVHGWRVVAGVAGGSGYGAEKTTGRERVWLSPNCLDPAPLLI